MSAPPSPQRACAGTCPAMVAAVPLGQGRSSQAALLPNTGEMCTCSMPSCDLERSEVQNLPGLGVSDKGLRTSVNCTGAATLEGFTTASNIQGKVLLLTICAAGIGGTFQFGYNLSIINAPTLHIQDFTNETWWARTGQPLPDHLVLLVWSLIVSLYPLGGLFGALLAGPLAIKLGRKKSLLVNNVFVVAAAILFGFSRRAGSFEMIMLGRLLVGVSAALQRLRGPADVAGELAELEQERAACRDRRARRPWELFRERALRRQVASLVVLGSAMELCGNDTVYAYASGVFREAGIPEEKVQYAIIGTGSCELLTAFVSCVVIERLGRRVLLMGGYCLMTCWGSVFTVALYLQSSIPWMPYLAMSCIFAFILSFGIGPGGLVPLHLCAFPRCVCLWGHLHWLLPP
ncbi:solute carrier family 2, facilitated glucose transporter member 11 isoform X12 [Equus przewalskii]|uniref:Solute carrier family 2, facilitated glucose transporter member 11 isoform X12 n=1 Tax=Equus przewalskii TaxID=9798 RepID=A0ABM4Q0K2_EQUPR